MSKTTPIGTTTSLLLTLHNIFTLVALATASAGNHNCQVTTARFCPASRRLTHFSFQVVGRFTVVLATGRPV